MSPRLLAGGPREAKNHGNFGTDRAPTLHLQRHVPTITAMRPLRSLLVFFLVLGFTPGLGELISDASHLLLEGHSAHAEHHAEHDGPSEEHGCTGWQHTCTCHNSLSVITVAEPGLPVVVGAGVSVWMTPRDRRADGVSFGIERPPRA